MSTERRRRGTVGKRKTGPAVGSQPLRVRLAPGVHLDGGGGEPDTPVLICPTGNVQLNGGAAAILRLCDGSRTRDDIVGAIVRVSPSRAIAADVSDFLNVAKVSGWIVET